VPHEKGRGVAQVAKTNLTIQLDEELVRRAKVVAAKRGTSVSALVAREIDQLASEDERYEEARVRALEFMTRAKPRGGRAWTRDDIYAARIDRMLRNKA
jgi:predicted transcriptional regulator